MRLSWVSSGAALDWKASKRVAFQGLDLGQGHRARVAMDTVDDELVMQVGAGRQAGGAHRADGLALLHFLALLHHPLGEVQVLGLDAAGMLDEHVVAIGCRIDRSGLPCRLPRRRPAFRAAHNNRCRCAAGCA